MMIARAATPDTRPGATARTTFIINVELRSMNLRYRVGHPRVERATQPRPASAGETR